MQPNLVVTIDAQSVNGNTIAGVCFHGAARRSFEPRKISIHRPKRYHTAEDVGNFTKVVAMQSQTGS